MSNPVDPAAEISCVDCVNALFHCYGAWHQFDRYYKDGHFDDCAKRKDELSLCMKLKMSDPEKQKALLRTLLHEDRSPTEGVIWKARPEPK